VKERRRKTEEGTNEKHSDKSKESEEERKVIERR
jgi:hypothetical protein